MTAIRIVSPFFIIVAFFLATFSRDTGANMICNQTGRWDPVHSTMHIEANCWYDFEYVNYVTRELEKAHSKGSFRFYQVGEESPGSAGEKKSEQVKSEDESTNCPVIISSGVKTLEEVDYVGVGEMPLKLVRTYSSRANDDVLMLYGLFGAHWRSNFDLYLLITYTDDTLCYTRVDGQLGNCPSAGSKVVKRLGVISNGQREDFGPACGGLSDWRPAANCNSRNYIRAQGTEWIYYNNGTILKFNLYGRLLSVTNENGISWTLTYNGSNNSGYLQSVTHTNGRSLRFTWSGAEPRVSSAMLPNGKSIQYTRGSPSYLTGVRYPEETGVRSYEYYKTFFLNKVFVDGIQWADYGWEGTWPNAKYSGLVDGVNRSNFTYGSNSTTVENPKGGQKLYSYDDKKRLTNISRRGTEVFPAAESLIKYQDAVSDKIQYREDWNGNRTSYTYDAYGNIDREYSGGKTKEYTWADSGKLKTETIWDGAKFPSLCGPVDPCPTPRSYPTIINEYIYGSFAANKGRLQYIKTKALKQSGTEYTPERVLTFSYEFEGSVVRKKIIDGPQAGISDVQVSQYNSKGDLISIADAGGNVITFRYQDSDAGLPYEMVDSNGLVSTFKYDAKGRLVEKVVKGPVLLTTKFQYFGNDRLKRVTYPNGNYEEFSLDGAGRIKQITRPGTDFQQEYDTFAYDSLSNLQSVKTIRVFAQTCTTAGVVHSCPQERLSLVKSTDTYDAYGNRKAELGQNGQSKSFSYDSNGNILSETDALGRSETYTYGAFDRIESVTNANGEVLTFTYDSMGYVSSVADAENNITEYYRNGFGEVEEHRNPDAGVTYYSYNDDGKVASILNERNITTSYEYDLSARLTAMFTTGSDHQNRSSRFFYDVTPSGSSLACSNGRGKICGFSDESGSTNYSYSLLGGVASQQTTIGGVTYLLAGTHDNFGRLSEMAYPNGVKLRYSYDVSNSVNKIEAYVGGLWKTVVTTTKSHDRKTLVFGNGISETRIHDLDGRTVSIESTVQSLKYSFNSVDDITSIVNGKNGQASLSLAYDGAGRVTKASGSWADQYFTYDENGNRKSIFSRGNTTTYSNSADGNRLDAVIWGPTGGVERDYDYDAVGNVISQTGNVGVRYTAKYDGFNQLSVLDPDASGGELPEYYTYNALNQRVRKNGPRGDFRYIYSPAGVLLAESGKTAAIGSIYIYLESRVVGVVRNNALYYVHTDHLGRPEVISDSVKTVVWRAINGAFERWVTVSNAAFGAFNLGFPGQYYDESSRLWYNWHRYYDASLGRYIQADPQGVAADPNTYSYVGSDPLTFVDPDGMEYYPHESPFHGDIAGATHHVQAYIVDRPEAIVSDFGPPLEVNGGVDNTDVDFIKVADQWYKIKGGTATIFEAPNGRVTVSGSKGFFYPVSNKSRVFRFWRFFRDKDGPKRHLDKYDPCKNGPISESRIK